MIDELIHYPILPVVPVGLLEAEDAYTNDKLLSAQIDRYCSKDGVSIPNTRYTRYPVNDKICAWVDKNIASDYADIGISFHGLLGGTNMTGTPHTDRTRHWTLIWLLDEGGPEVDTVYWQEENKPVIRIGDVRSVSYDNLSEIGRARLKKHKWVLLDARAIHSIEGLTGLRKSLQIGFWNSAQSLQRFKNTSS